MRPSPCHADSGLDIITGNAIIVAALFTTHVGAYRWKDLDTEILDMPDDLFEPLVSVRHAECEPAGDPAPQLLGAKPPVVELDDHIIALLQRGYRDSCGYYLPSEVRAALYRALCMAGYTAEHIAYAIERSPLRYYADRIRPPLSGNALFQDIKKVLALPYTESTESERDSGMPRAHITPGPFKDYTTPCGAANACRQIVKGLIPVDAAGILYGEAGSYKTFIALDLALHIAHGLPWRDRKTLGGLVLYVAGEGENSLRYRIEAWHKRQSLDPSAVPLRVCTTLPPLNDKDCAASVKAAIRQLGTELGAPVPTLVGILSQNFDGNENSTSEMAMFFRILTTEIRAACQGSSVVLVHHTGHSEIRARGGYTAKTNTDFMFRLEGQAHKVTLTCEKMKDAECPAPLSSDLHMMDLGVDEDTDPRSSLTAELSPTASAPATGQRRHSKHSATLLAVMYDLEHGALGPEIREAFNKACRELTEEARRRGFNRALEAARQDGWIVRSPNGILSPAARSI